MTCLEISAKIINWPPVCACCCQRADTTVPISSTRVTGKKVVKSQTKSWDIPYCRRCLGHTKVAQELLAFSTFVLHRSVLIGLAGAMVTLFLTGALLEVAQRTAIWCFFISAVGTVAVTAATFTTFQREYEQQKKKKLRARAELEKKLEGLMCQHCATEELAATYSHWHGTVHTFYFSNPHFVALVEAANPT